MTESKRGSDRTQDEPTVAVFDGWDFIPVRLAETRPLSYSTHRDKDVATQDSRPPLRQR